MADLDPHKDYDLDDLSDEEKVALAYARSNASKADFDPAEAEPHEKVVELADRSSHVVADLVDHDDPVIAADAQAVVDGNFPGGPNYPNGPAEAPKKTAAPAKQAQPAPSSGSQS